MDVRCPICGEAWDVGEFADSKNPEKTRERFREIGCEAFPWASHNEENINLAAADKAAEIFNSGEEDWDFLASLMEGNGRQKFPFLGG
jgi:uncharacterized Zn finger protein (UPF0148 family)